MKTMTILGSTGSIGTQALEVAAKHNIKVKALAANSDIEKLAAQSKELLPERVCIYREDKKTELEKLLSGTGIKISTGMEGLKEIARMDGVDIMLNSVVGMVGLVPTLTAIEKGIDIALANKETLVAGGELVIKAAAEKGVKIYPVDSEHSAIFQCLQGNEGNKLKGIILTASGGPFFGKTKSDLEGVTVEQALNHPNWSMGRKITIDSATLMNKGLEFIEAMWLFKLRPEQIEIVVHRQSVVHSAVEYEDNSVIAQLGVPDMKIPIQYALLYPERVECDVKKLSLTDYGKLHRLALKACGGINKGKSFCSLENLQNGSVFFHLYNSCKAACAVIKFYFRHFVIGNTAYMVKCNERAVYFAKTDIFYVHAPAPPVKASISAFIFFSYSSKSSILSFGISYLTLISFSIQPQPIILSTFTPCESAFFARA